MNRTAYCEWLIGSLHSFFAARNVFSPHPEGTVGPFFTINYAAGFSEQTPLPFFVFSKIIVHRDKRSAKHLY